MGKYFKATVKEPKCSETEECLPASIQPGWRRNRELSSSGQDSHTKRCLNTCQGAGWLTASSFLSLPQRWSTQQGWESGRSLAHAHPTHPICAGHHPWAGSIDCFRPQGKGLALRRSKCSWNGSGREDLTSFISRRDQAEVRKGKSVQ